MSITVNEDIKDAAKRDRQGYVILPLGVILFFAVFWPLRDIALVYWVRGSAAYAAGIRVLKGKPTRFSDGQVAPNLPDFVTGMAAFLVAIFTAILLTWVIFRVYEKICSRRAASHQ